MVSDIRRSMLKSQEVVDDQRQLVSDTPTTSTIERKFTVSQNGTRLANSAANGFNILYLCLVPLVNHLPRRRGPVSDATS